MNLLYAITLLVPVWFGDTGVAELCESDGVKTYTHRGTTVEFEVHLTSREDMFKHCGDAHNGRPARACLVDNYHVYVTAGVMCSHSMAHELNHALGMHFVDRPAIHEDA